MELNGVIKLQEYNGKSKKSGNDYTAYRVCIGRYKSPLFFPSEIETLYIKSLIQKRAHEDFKGDDLSDVEGE